MFELQESLLCGWDEGVRESAPKMIWPRNTSLYMKRYNTKSERAVHDLVEKIEMSIANSTDRRCGIENEAKRT